MKHVGVIYHEVINHKLILLHETKDMYHKQKCQIQHMSKVEGKKSV